MTDNRTTELLRKLLDERGVEYLTNDDERAYDELARTTWDFILCGYEMTVTATEFVDIEGKTYLEMDFHHAFTPEQAIAATLGNDEYESKMDALLCRLTNGKWSKSRSYDLDFMVSCVEEEFEAAELENGTYKRIAELEERIGALESENAKLREADAVNDLALSYVAVKADRDACKKLVESYMAENDALYTENVKLEYRASELEELVQDWQALYEEPDYGDCCRLRKRMQALGIEVVDE